ncbi:MAG: hypothetical protein ACQEQV_03740 [Fibrobacterota bacterium]
MISSLLFLCTGCFNPFWPETDLPAGAAGAATPKDAVALLQEAYEKRRISLFEQVVYDTSEFRSYIYVPVTSTVDFPFGAETIPDTVVFDAAVPRELKYVPLSYDRERKIHENLFSGVEDLYFGKSLVVESLDYFSADGTPADSSSFEYVAAKTGNAEIVITAPAMFGAGKKIFTIEGQYFLLKKDSRGHFKIWKWIEYNE